MPKSPFFNNTTFALYGMSRNKAKFGNALYNHLSRNGYRLYPIHPEAESIQGVQTYRSLAELPQKPAGVIINLPPPRTLEALREVAEAGIEEVFLQQGSESKEVLDLCRELRLRAFYGSCAILNSKPTGAHKVHAFFARMFGGWAKEQRPLR